MIDIPDQGPIPGWSELAISSDHLGSLSNREMSQDDGHGPTLGKPSKPIQKKTMQFLGIMFGVFLVALFMIIGVFLGSTGNGGNNNANDNLPVYDDAQFISFIRSSSGTLQGYMSDVAYYSGNYDVENLGTVAHDLYVQSNYYENRITTFDVSPSKQWLKNEFAAALHDTTQAGYYIWQGCVYYDADYLQQGVDYLNAAKEHMDNVLAMV